MAGKLSIDLSLNAKGYKEGANEASYATKTLRQDTQAYIKEFGTLRKQFRDAQKDAMNLAAQFNSLSKAERDSPIGKELKQQMDEAIQRAGELKDVMADTQQAISNTASDTAKFDAFKESLENVGNLAVTVAGGIATMSGSQEDFNRALAAYATVEKGLQTIIGVTNSLQAQSSTMLAINNLQRAAATKAIALQAKTTKLAAVEQRIFNAVANANPYVILATAALGVVTALGAYAIATHRSTNAMTEEQKALEESKKRWNEYKQSINTSSASVLADYQKLSVEWKTLSSNHEKNQWIDANKSKFTAMGLSINSIYDAETVFVKMTSSVVAALKARAEAEAWGEVYKKRLEQKINNDLNGSVDNGRFYRQVKAGQDAFKSLTAEEAKALGISRQTTTTIQSSAGAITQSVNNTLTAQDAALVNQYRMNQAVNKQKQEIADLTKIQNGYTNALEKSAEAQSKIVQFTSTKHTRGGGGRTTNKPDKQDKQFDFTAAFEKNLNKNSDALTKFVNDSEDALARLKQTWDDIFKDNKQSTYEQYVPSQNNTTTLSGIKAEMDANDDLIAKLKEVRDEYQKLGDVAAVNQITAQIEGLVKANTDLGQSAQNMVEHQKQLAEQARIAAEQQQKFEEQQEKLNQYKDAISNIGAAFSGLGSAIGDSTGKIMEFAGQALQTAANILPTIVQLIAAKQAESLASGTASAAKLPFPANVAAIASIVAQIMALFASFPKFESGGVISGSSFHGDNVIARVNSGEMIINRRQQSNLFNAIDQNKLGGTSNIQIGGVIRGTDILLVAKNQNNINKLSGTNIHF